MTDAPPGTFERSRSDALALVEKAIAFLKSKRGERLASAEIDPARLQTIAEAAGADGFSKTTANFPIPLFGKVELVDVALTPFTLRLQKVERGAYTRPRMAEPVSNEVSWWRDTMKDRSAFMVLDDVLRAAPADEIAVTGPEDYWHKIRDRAAAIAAEGAEPILLVQSEFHPRWLYDWRWGRIDARSPKRPADLQVSQHDGQDSAYLFHMNAIAVYQAPIRDKLSYLLPANLFRELRFTKYATGLPVDVQWVQDPQDAEHGTIAASFARDVSVGDGRVLRVRYA